MSDSKTELLENDNNQQQQQQQQNVDYPDDLRDQVQKTLEMLKTGVRKQRRTNRKRKNRPRRKRPMVDTSDSDECNYPELMEAKKAKLSAASKKKQITSKGPVNNHQPSAKRKKKKKSKKGKGQIKTVPGILTRSVSIKNKRENFVKMAHDSGLSSVIDSDNNNNNNNNDVEHKNAIAISITEKEETPEMRIHKQQSERRKNRSIIPKEKIITGENVSLQSVTDTDYIRDRASRGKPVTAVPPELQSLPYAPSFGSDATENKNEQQQQQQQNTMLRYYPPNAKDNNSKTSNNGCSGGSDRGENDTNSNVNSEEPGCGTGIIDSFSSKTTYNIEELARKWDQHKKMGTEGMVALVSPMRDLAYRFANAPGKSPKQIVDSLAESINDAVDADLNYIHEQQIEKSEPLPDDTLIKRAKRDEELDQIDTFYHTMLGGPTVRNIVETTELAKREAEAQGRKFRYSALNQKQKCGPKERVVRKMLEYSKNIESGFMWRAYTGINPNNLAASDLGDPVTLEWASKFMRERAEGSDERNCLLGPKYCICKQIPKLRKACDSVDTVQDEEGFVGIEFYRREEWNQLRAVGKLPKARRPCILCLIYLQTQKVGEVQARGVLFDTQIQYFRVATEENGKGWSKCRCLPQVLDDGSPTGIVADTPEFHVQDYIPSQTTVYVNNGTEPRIVKCFLYRVHSF